MTTYYSTFYPLESADGAKGSAAFLGAISTALVYLYKRSATVLIDADKPNGNVIYTFATGNKNISSVSNGWAINIPSGTDPLYVVAATATGTDPTDTIASTEWSSPVILSKDGLAGTSVATIFLFKRGTTSTLPTVPTQTATYTFSSGVLIGTSSAGNTVSPYLDGWSQTAPDSSGGKYLFVTTATAISTGTTDTILTAEWATVRILAQDGAVGYTAYLTNESHTLPAAADGTVSTYTGATGSFRIYLDGVGDISSNFTLSTVSDPQVLVETYTYPSGIPTYTVTGGFDSGEDVATMTIRATGSGAYSAVTIDKVFSLSKSKAGADGSPAKFMSIVADRQLISFASDGTLSPSTGQNITITANKQNTSATVNWTIKDTAGNVLTPSSYLTPVAGNSTVLTGALFRSAILLNGAQGVVITATLVDGATLTDTITVMKVQAATNGTNGTNGTDGAAAVVASLTKDSQTLFAYADGSVVSFASANGLFKIYSGTTDVTASADNFTATLSGCTGTVNSAVNTPVNGQPIGYYQVTAMSADTATLTVSARYPAIVSGTTYTKVFTLSKAKGGYEIVSALPTTNLFVGRMVFLTTDNKLYRCDGTTFISSVPAVDISGTITNAQIAALAASKITGQLTDTQIAAVAASKLTGQITSTQITDGAISTAKLAAGSITSNEIAANTIVAADIAVGTITATELAAGSITTAKIAAGAVTAGTIAAGAITAGKIAADAVTATEIAANAVTANEISAGAVTAAKISVTSLSAISATIGTLRTATTGARTEISDNIIKVYDSSSTSATTGLRVKIGDLSL